MEKLCWDVMVTMAELISSSSLHQPTSVISASKTAAAAAYSLFVLSSFLFDLLAANFFLAGGRLSWVCCFAVALLLPVSGGRD